MKVVSQITMCAVLHTQPAVVKRVELYECVEDCVVLSARARGLRSMFDKYYMGIFRSIGGSGLLDAILRRIRGGGRMDMVDTVPAEPMDTPIDDNVQLSATGAAVMLTGLSPRDK